ncbi:hypothetical protein CHS0354_018548 [Potamilus streckersoni]|uniref:N(6)-L-threonylcarbamoyladenine synthase n=1 Tax=Potamilus streckersoni TaxID=2493646 RepID=A0AAE0TAT1_9BIVA|nr:hypothetical protein CHS0354_018548 [Potamilus streckersoni]
MTLQSGSTRAKDNPLIPLQDSIICRAFSDTQTVLNYALHYLKQGGTVFIWKSPEQRVAETRDSSDSAVHIGEVSFDRSCAGEYHIEFNGVCHSGCVMAYHGRVLTEKTLNLSYQHSKFGGVVPEIAGRGHLAAFKELLTNILQSPVFSPKQLQAIAVTRSPGLIGSLLVGVTYAKTLAWVYEKPLIAVDHIEGHLFSGFIGQPAPRFPFSALVISGGHTLLVNVEGVNQYTVFGRTTDDSVGEAFDKTAKILGFVYPGGPVIDRLAVLACERGIPPVKFPVPLRGRDTFDFSFSGLKTAVLYHAKDAGLYHPERELITVEDFLAQSDTDILNRTLSVARGFQETIAVIFEERITQTIRASRVKEFHICGGVAANSAVRKLTAQLAERLGVNFRCPEMKYCGDNAAMIGYIARLYMQKGFMLTETPDILNAEPSAAGRFSI